MLINIIHNDFKTKNKASGNSNTLLWVVLISLLLGASFFMPAKRKDLTGMKFGLLTVVNFSHSTAKEYSMWNCICDCGNTTTVRGNFLKQGKTKSCGCRKGNYIHGMVYTSEWKAYISMKRRCYEKTGKGYQYYGGRGISVCSRWLESFENFFMDMGIKPSKTHSLDRIDVNGNYEPNNCRWATAIEQGRNKTHFKKISYIGQDKLPCEWSEIFGISSRRIVARLAAGWSVEATLTTPLVPNDKTRQQYNKRTKNNLL